MVTLLIGYAIRCIQRWKPKPEPEKLVLRKIFETQTKTGISQIFENLNLNQNLFFLQLSKPKLKLKPVQNFLRFWVLKIVITMITRTVPLMLSVKHRSCEY